jgi:aryl-alcohol dehydrogenase-like predicted oxidoreductase
MPGVDTVVLGVTNRAQLYECLAAEKSGPLDAETMRLIDQSV